ncbi:hypothetical protein [Lactococcus garvieae]|uniref:hypothetical protein n=1 Tax=Lactococcus garvieae TaxID=1363 RepID=UPI0003116E1A|nr:hypothetical protein [Lactococcus garvieae]
MAKTAKERIEEEIKDAKRNTTYQINKQSGVFNNGVLQGLKIALVHVENATTLVTSDETVTIDKEVYDLLINKVNKQREQLATTVEALKYLVSAQEQLWTSTNGRGLVDEAMDHAKQALAEIGGEDE